MEKFENINRYLVMNNDCLFNDKYIDNIFLIYTGGEAKLNIFINSLNMMLDSQI